MLLKLLPFPSPCPNSSIFNNKSTFKNSLDPQSFFVFFFNSNLNKRLFKIKRHDMWPKKFRYFHPWHILHKMLELKVYIHHSSLKWYCTLKEGVIELYPLHHLHLLLPHQHTIQLVFFLLLKTSFSTCSLFELLPRWFIFSSKQPFFHVRAKALVHNCNLYYKIIHMHLKYLSSILLTSQPSFPSLTFKSTICLAKL